MTATSPGASTTIASAGRRALLGGDVLGECPQLDVLARACRARHANRSTREDFGAQRVGAADRAADAVERGEALVVVQRSAQHVAVAGDDGQGAAQLVREDGELLARDRTGCVVVGGRQLVLGLGRVGRRSCAAASVALLRARC